MTVTSKGKMWEIINSLWILFTFTLGFFNWIAFFYIGIRVRYLRWIIWGLIYSLPFIIMIGIHPSREEALSTIGVLLTIAGGIVSIFHAFVIRNEFLLRLEARQNIYQKTTIPQLKENITREYGVNSNFERELQPGGNPEGTTADSVLNTPADTVSVVDINHDPEEVLAALPGVGIILAKKAVSLRQEQSGFKSIEDFGGSLGLNPHIIEQLKPMVVITPLEKAVKQPSSQGRVIDY